MRAQKTTLLFFLFAFLMANGMYGGELEETFDKTFPLEKGQHFSLKNTNGSVRLYGWDRQEVRIEAIKRVKAASRSQAERIMQQLEIQIERTDAGIFVDTIVPISLRHGFLSWLFDGFSSHGVEVKYTIWLPNDVLSEVRTVNGSIFINELRGDINVRTTNGRIRVESASGSVKANTTNGSVNVELVEVEPGSEIRMRTTNGSVKLYLPKDFAGEIKARTTNGSITTDFPIEVMGQLNRRRLEGRIGEGGDVLCDIATTNGSVKILQIE
ncbi:MAG: DUF4097 family beta strand repeat-containing protein [candidate division KSB1 bacterium]|nr:DUF4097 family beta strand repeat-containing protein [candidate division KSB1 bacterium]